MGAYSRKYSNDAARALPTPTGISRYTSSARLARGRMRIKHAAPGRGTHQEFDDRHAELAQILLTQIDHLTSQIDHLTTRAEQEIAGIPRSGH